ncbi:hypothetical protein B7494_g870 [Chlorociboria aeruginascens]|nr:hypothetical protein B7494_g870 [Chlorociboria aeruginascens]
MSQPCQDPGNLSLGLDIPENHLSPSPSPPLSLPRKHRRRKYRKTSGPLDDSSDALIRTITTLLPPMPPPTRLLVCSIGNPGKYLCTLHSAGHTVLAALASKLQYPPFKKLRGSRKDWGNGMVSFGSEYTLWQSTSLMNESGKGVADAWKRFIGEVRAEDGDVETKLVVVHDELELPVGQVKVKKGDLSASGHNGLKNIKDVFYGLGIQKWHRIGVGIGRPESRAPGAVQEYVLRRMNHSEQAKIEGAVEKVELELQKLKME